MLYNEVDKAIHNVIIESTTCQTLPTIIRENSLKVLLKVPKLAERHSRELVPHLLWEEDNDDEDDNEGSSWTFKERLVLLELFSNFVNPKSFYRSEEVYDRYLYLLANRNMPIQKTALSCILTFKNPQVKIYKDNLFNLLDETQFKDELTKLLKYPDDEEGIIHYDDRKAILPLVMRIIFGRSQVSKSGGVKQGRRFAVINSLNNVEPAFVDLFISLATSRLDASGFITKSSEGKLQLNEKFENLSSGQKLVRRELGFLTMLEAIVDNLGAKVKISINNIMESLIFSLYDSRLAADDVFETDGSNVIGKNMRAIRTVGIRCLTLLTKTLDPKDWSDYFAIVFDHFIDPRLEHFAEQNLQQQSALMKYFVTLSTKISLLPFLAWKQCSIIKSLVSCLNYDGVKDSVIEAVIVSVTNIVNLKQDENHASYTAVLDEILSSIILMILSRIPFLFEREGSSMHLLEMEAGLLVKLSSSFVADNNVRKQLIQVSLALLDKANVPVRIKTSIFKALTSLLKDDRSSEDEILPVYTGLAKLFKQFKDQEARKSLSELYEMFGTRLPQLSRIGKLVADLNSYSPKRISLPDFDRRLAAFAQVNEKGYAEYSVQEWQPLVYNMLFFIKDPEELALRTNSSYSLKRYVDGFSLKVSVEDAQGYIDLLEDAILPSIRIGIRDSSEIFRAEYIGILAHLIKNSKWYGAMDDMKCLLFDGDDEANFFYNISHVQMHRRQRAVRRLGLLGGQNKLRDNSIAHYLLPIIEVYVSESVDANLSAEALKSIGILTRHISWNQYRAITKRYVSYLVNRPDAMKTTTKLIDTVADAISQPEEAIDKNDEDEIDIDMKSDYDSDIQVDGSVLLKENLPGGEKLANFITNDIVPTMQKVLTTKQQEDDDSLTTRIPLAIPIVKFLTALPPNLVELRLPGVLTGFCQILRAKSQELRDTIRRSLGKIARLLGAKYLIFIIKELRSALRRGAQLHILGYSVHSLLVEIKKVLKPGDLDSASSIISEIIMEDTFGVTGYEKDSEDYHSKMKEVQQHKSADTGEILASNISLSAFANLIEPVKAVLLYKKLSLKVERKVEELLRRTGLGLQRNSEATDLKVLVMCHELYRMIEKVSEEELERQRIKELSYKDEQRKETEEHFTVQLDSRHWNERNTVYVDNLHILTRFIMDSLRTVLGKSEHLMTAENVAAFVPMLDDGLRSKFEDVQIASLRVLAFIIKLPIPDLEKKLLGFGKQTLSLIKSCPSTNTELCQASLRFLAVLIRQKKEFSVKDSALVYVLQRIKPDLEEPDRQGITFTFLKAVLSRTIILEEVYDVMDRVAEVMVTNQTRTTRDVCRSAYFQFLTDYPLGKGRLKKQLSFLVSNLEYPSPAGRLSVMEMMHLILTKINNNGKIQEATTSFFVALVLVLVNDDVSECRENAATILGELMNIAKESEEQVKYIESYCEYWLKTDDQLLLRGGLQVISIYFTEFKDKYNPDLLSLAESKISEILTNGQSNSNVEVPWEVVYFGMQLFNKIVLHTVPDVAFKSEYLPMWDLIEGSLLYPHSWVRLVASRLMGFLYSKAQEGSTFPTLVRADNLQKTAFKYLRQLGATSISDELGIQIVKNLVFIASQWEEGGTKYVKPMTKEEDIDEYEEEQGESEEFSALSWLITKVASVLRNEKRAKEMIVSKRSSIQYLAAVIQITTDESLKDLSQDIIMALYPFSVSDDERHKEFRDLCTEVLTMMQEKLGTTDYLKSYSAVRQIIVDRRIERKTKRAVEAVANPELHAKKKLKKNLVKRVKRKQVKDENGYYHSKKKKVA